MAFQQGGVITQSFQQGGEVSATEPTVDPASSQLFKQLGGKFPSQGPPLKLQQLPGSTAPIRVTDTEEIQRRKAFQGLFWDSF